MGFRKMEWKKLDGKKGWKNNGKVGKKQVKNNRQDQMVRGGKTTIQPTNWKINIQL